MKKLGEHEILWYLQKFHGKFYVLAALSNCFLERRFGNPLRKFFCGFGFVEFSMRSTTSPDGVWGVCLRMSVSLRETFRFCVVGLGVLLPKGVWGWSVVKELSARYDRITLFSRTLTLTNQAERVKGFQSEREYSSLHISFQYL
jgi:hypothetical protein